jgi:hypothetical protein
MNDFWIFDCPVIVFDAYRLGTLRIPPLGRVSAARPRQHWLSKDLQPSGGKREVGTSANWPATSRDPIFADL